jgi:hypothetical protein
MYMDLVASSFITTLSCITLRTLNTSTDSLLSENLIAYGLIAIR